jgi:hypothetical protein
VREQWGILHPSHPETIVGQPEYDSYMYASHRAGSLLLQYNTAVDLLSGIFSCLYVSVCLIENARQQVGKGLFHD